MTTIVHPAGSTEPQLWMEYASTATTSTVVHTTMDSETIVVYGTVTPRRVKLALLYSSEDDSFAAEQLHLTPGIFTIIEGDRRTHDMRYVVVGAVSRTLDQTTANVWILEVDAQEVTA